MTTTAAEHITALIETALHNSGRLAGLPGDSTCSDTVVCGVRKHTDYCVHYISETSSATSGERDSTVRYQGLVKGQ